MDQKSTWSKWDFPLTWEASFSSVLNLCCSLREEGKPVGGQRRREHALRHLRGRDHALLHRERDGQARRHPGPDR